MCLGSVGTVDRIWDEGGVPMGWVSGVGVCLLYTPEAKVGDRLLTHMGFAVEILDDVRAEIAIEMRSELLERQAVADR